MDSYKWYELMSLTHELAIDYAVEIQLPGN